MTSTSSSSNKIRISFSNNVQLENGNCSKIPHFRSGTTCPMPGMTVEILALITNYLNLTVEIAKVVKMSPGWTNAFEEVYQNETDTYGLLFLEHTEEFMEKYDFTSTIYLENIKAVVRRSDQSLKNAFDFFNLYQLNTWLCMTIVFIVFTLFGLLVRYVEVKLMLRNRFEFSEILWKMVRYQLVQPEEIDYTLSAGKTSTIVFSLFQVCIILGIFQGLILTNVVKKFDPAPFKKDDFHRLIKEGRLTIVKPEKNTDIPQEIASCQDLNDAIKFNPYQSVENVFQTIHQNMGFVTLVHEYAYMWHIYWPENCDFILVDTPIPPRPQRFMFRKGSKFTPLFDRAINANKPLIDRITRKYLTFPPPSKCKMLSGKPTPITIAPYIGLLIPFFSGIILACFVFSGEMLNQEFSVYKLFCEFFNLSKRKKNEMFGETWNFCENVV